MIVKLITIQIANLAKNLILHAVEIQIAKGFVKVLVSGIAVRGVRAFAL